MKFSGIIKGTRAERDVDLPGFEVDGKPVRALMRALNGTEEADVLRAATEFAVRKGAAEPKPGDPLFDLSVMAHTLAIACLDPDSSPRVPFFDGGAPQVLDELPRETIVYLYERQETWQSESSPYHRQMSEGELVAKVREVAASRDDGPFTQLSPGMRWIFARSMASMLLPSLEPKSSTT